MSSSAHNRRSVLASIDREPASVARLAKPAGARESPARPGEGGEIAAASASSSDLVGQSRKGRSVDVISTRVQRVALGGEIGELQVLRHEWKRKRTRFLRWEFERHGRTHSVQLEHGLLWGSRLISVDDETVLKERIVFDAGSTYRFAFGGLEFKVLLLASSKGFEYELLVNQRKPEDDAREAGETTFSFEAPEGCGPDSP